MYLLDTNICIYFMKNTYPQLTERILSCPPSDFLISAITVFELEYGAEKSNWGDKTRHKLAMFLSPFQLLPVNFAAFWKRMELQSDHMIYRLPPRESPEASF